MYSPFSEADGAQFGPDAAAEGYNQAQMRIHVERCIKHLKEWRYLDRVIPPPHISFLDKIVGACAAMTNICNMPMGPRELMEFYRLSGRV